LNKNHSFDEIDLNKNGGKHENNKTDKKINKNNKNKEKKISNDDNIMNIDIKKKEKAIYIKNNSQVALSLNETENNNNINRQNILISGLKNNNNYNNNSLKFNNNSLNNINNIKTEPESKFKNINSKIPSNIIKDTKLLNMAKIDISSDSEEEQKKANEDPFLIPKKKNEQFIMEDDSFDFLVN
jgi:hypothetical protein